MSGGAVSAEFHVAFAREFHVGAGHGREGGVDSALFTEVHAGREEPAIRYGHGVLAQAVYDLLAAIPDSAKLPRCRASGAEGPEFCSVDDPPCPVCQVFGSPARPSPWSFSTLRPVERAASKVGAGARTVSRAAIDPRTRRAGDGTLFSEELGAPRTFSFRAERAVGDEAAALDELALLVAAACTVRGIGADRRRGRGECSIGLASTEGAGGLDADTLLERFGNAWVGGERAAASSPARAATFSKATLTDPWKAPQDAEWTAFRLLLRLDEPLIAGSLPLTGNLLAGEPFVPGSLLLGALAGRVLSGRSPDEGAFLRVFRSGAAQFPDLHPLEPVGSELLPVLPAPRDLFTCERVPGPAGHGLWSRLLAPETAGCPVCAAAVKPQRVSGWLVPAGGDRWRSGFSTAEETKIQVDRGTGRVHGGSLYHREVIPAGTLLAGTLRVRGDALAELRGWGLLEEGGSVSLRLGKRHGRGYGAANLSWSAAGDDRAAVRSRIEAMVVPRAAIPLVATSRVLLRDGFGRVRQSLSATHFGLEEEMDGGCAVAARPVGGFWRHVGLPRRQEVALEPGSVLLVRVPEALDDGARAALVDRLVALAMEEPVGERVAEGFGRFAVGPFPYGWTADGEAFAAADPRFAGVELPASSRVDVRGDLRMDPRIEAREAFAEKLKGVELEHDEWRAVARFLYANAGRKDEALIRTLTQGGGRPRRELDDATADRGTRHFLDGSRERVTASWKRLEPLIREAAAGNDASLRAMCTRALADALAQAITPGKVLA